MPIESLIKPNLYKDSVALMRIAETLLALPGVRRATLVMATPANKAILSAAGLLLDGMDVARTGDLLLAVEADETESARAAVAAADLALEGRRTAAAGAPAERPVPRSLGMALEEVPGASLAQISVPGPYAAAEAVKALRRGLHVFLFSDNVPIEQERAIKTLADQKGLLVMGPDCGTATISGVPLGFSNKVRRGSIGLIGASGTGLQAVSCRIHQLGEGISHAIGTGSRDLQREVGAKSTRRAMAWLDADTATRVIVLVSKTPSPDIARQIASEAASLSKPAVVLFLGAADMPSAPSVHSAATLAEAAQTAVALARGEPAATQLAGTSAAQAFDLAPEQRYLRGLFSGGTFCAEAQLIWKAQGIAAWSNVPLDARLTLPEPHRSREHTAVDLGSDEFTMGRPHPMIDYGIRLERLVGEAADPGTAAILLDVVLGYGSHPDPARVLAPALKEVRRVAESAGRLLPVVGFVCGTEDDPQRLTDQCKALTAAGMLLAESSSAAAYIAGEIALKCARAAR